MQFVNLAAEEKVNPLVPHTAELVVGAIAFSLLFYVLRKFVVPMFEKAFEARTQAIQGGIAVSYTHLTLPTILLV